MYKYSIFCALIVLCGCALYDPLDRDTYEGQAKGQIIVEDIPYQNDWDIQIHRTSSFNPYDPDGRQDGWCVNPSGKLFTLPNGTSVWIDLSESNPNPIDILGITGAQPVKPAPLKSAPLSAFHSIDAIAPVFWVDTSTDGQSVKVRSCEGCQARIHYMVGNDYIGPSEMARHESAGMPRLNFYDSMCTANSSEDVEIKKAVWSLKNSKH